MCEELVGCVKHSQHIPQANQPEDWPLRGQAATMMQKTLPDFASVHTDDVHMLTAHLDILPGIGV